MVARPLRTSLRENDGDDNDVDGIAYTHEILLNAYELPTQIRYNEPQQLVTSAMHARARATYGLHHMHDVWCW